jgi:hypothetical protein
VWRAELRKQSLVARILPVVGFVVLVVRYWDAFARPQFIYEDAAAFWAPTFEDSGPQLLLRPWAGFLRVTQRLIFLSARGAPYALAPVVTLIIFYGVIALVARFVLSERMANAIPSYGARVLIAAFLFVIPDTTEMLRSSLNVEWFSWIFLLCVGLATPARGILSVAEGLAAVVVGLTGPMVIPMLPLFVRRQVRSRPVLVGALILCAVAQVLVYVTSTRRPALPSGAVESAYAFIRQVASSVLGARLGQLLDGVAFPWLLALVGLFILVAASACSRNLPRATAASFWTPALAAGAASLISVGAFSMMVPGQNARYFIPMAMAVCGIAALTLSRRPYSLASVALGAAVLAGSTTDFPVDEVPSGDWAVEHGCIGGPDPCHVSVYPTIWSVDWPGLGNGYRIPTGFTEDGRPTY